MTFHQLQAIDLTFRLIVAPRLTQCGSHPPALAALGRFDVERAVVVVVVRVGDGLDVPLIAGPSGGMDGARAGIGPGVVAGAGEVEDDRPAVPVVVDVLEVDQPAETLDRLMRGEAAPPRVRIPPRGVVPRGSAEAAREVEDEAVAEALRYIRANADKPLSVDEVVEHVGGSRRRLEYAFRRHLGRSPHAEILRAHLDLAKRLLIGTDPPITRIARLAGFDDARHFSTMFRKREGASPRDYRRGATCTGP